MGKLHELLAVARDKQSQSKILLADTASKFGKVASFFSGHIKTLAMLSDTPENRAKEQAEQETKTVVTTVKSTLSYALELWGKSEDVLFQINKSNQTALANLEFRGKVVRENVPVDELMGLAVRLEELRKVFLVMPSLDAGTVWHKDTNDLPDIWRSEPIITIKTEKSIDAKVLYPHSDNHPAQIREYSRDEVVGSFTLTRFSGAVTTMQKANSISNIEELIQEVKKAQMRANCVEASRDTIGGEIIRIIMEPIN